MNLILPKTFTDRTMQKSLELCLQGFGSKKETQAIICCYKQDQEQIIEEEYNWWIPTSNPFYLEIRNNKIIIPQVKLNEMNFKKSHINTSRKRFYIWNREPYNALIKEMKNLSSNTEASMFEEIRKECIKNEINLFL